jgi:hypothetical protein
MLRMNRKLPSATVALVFLLLIDSIGCFRNHRSVNCMRDGDASNLKVETLKREAHERLKIATKKDAVIRFFADSTIPVTFDRKEASGSIYIVGACAPKGCGTNRVLLGLRIGVDEAGTVVSDPVIVAFFADCV